MGKRISEKRTSRKQRSDRKPYKKAGIIIGGGNACNFGARRVQTGCEYDGRRLQKGFEICRTIRNRSNVPIIIVSAKKEDIDKIRGLGLGADDYMTKPFSPAELVARIKSHLARYNRLFDQKVADGNEELKIKGLVINKRSRRVHLNGREIQFTTKEFDLLVFLAENPDRVFSKVQIFEKIWGVDTLGEIATVAVHIRRIREKIESDTSNPEYIETIWGTGYRLNN